MSKTDLKTNSKNAQIPISDKEYMGKPLKETMQNNKSVYVINSSRRNRKWNNNDLESLKRFYNRETNELLLLKYYSFLQIKSAAAHLELPYATYSTKWSDLDDSLVRIAYRGNGEKISMRFSEEQMAFSKLKLLGREAYMIKRRAIELGLIEENIGGNRASTIWSNYEISILKKEYPQCGCSIAELLDLGRSLSAIENKAKSLGLHHKGAM